MARALAREGALVYLADVGESWRERVSKAVRVASGRALPIHQPVEGR